MPDHRVLVVDPELGHASHVQSSLARAGVEVAIVTTAPLAVASLLERSADAVIFSVPCVGGEEALVRAADSRGAVLVPTSRIFTGRTNEALVREAWGVQLRSCPLDAVALLDEWGWASHGREREQQRDEESARAETVVPDTLDASGAGLSGTLSELAFGALLCALARTASTGELSVAVDGVARRVVFDGGRVVGVTSEALGEGVDEILLADGVVDAQTLERIRREQGYAATESEASYAAAGVVESGELPALRSLVARRRLHALHGARSGIWEFRSLDVRALPAQGVDLSALQVAWEGARHAVDPSVIRASLADYLRLPVTWTSAPPTRAAVSLTGWQRAFVGSLDGEVPLEELLIDVPDRESALALIYALAGSGYIAFRER